MLSLLNPLPILPGYTGPYKVGTTEYEIPIASLGFENNLGEFPASTVKFRVFYPANPKALSDFGEPWLPAPQTLHLSAYLRMARLGPWLSKLLLSIPLYLRSTTIPVYREATLKHDSTPFPVLIFSHGLVGSMNTHSALLGELASRGLVCVAVDHRDGSSVLSLAHEEMDKFKAIYFKSVSLKIRPGLMATYRALELINNGTCLANLLHGLGDTDGVLTAGSLDLSPGAVIWAGHSFGGATMIQFFKIVYQETKAMHEQGTVSGRDVEESLLLQCPPRGLLAQLKSTSPLILLDPWFMPLRSPQTRGLFNTPLPCHEAASDRPYGECSRTIAVLSSECAWHWPEVHSHMPQIFAVEPEKVKTQTEAETIEQFKLFLGPRHFMNESKRQNGVSKRTEKHLNREPGATAIFVLRVTTHVTLSDFGLMFPWITWWFTGQRRPMAANWNVVRCILNAAGLERLQSDDPLPSQVAADAQLEQIYY